MRTVRLSLFVLACVMSPQVAFSQQVKTKMPQGDSEAAVEVRQIFRVKLDEARLLRMEAEAQTLIIANPAVADAAVHDGKTLIITGKAFGSTNLMALDRAGKVIMERQIQVQEPESSILVVQRGVSSETYSCTPKCKPFAVNGDSQEYLSNFVSQSQQRAGWAKSGAN